MSAEANVLESRVTDAPRPPKDYTHPPDNIGLPVFLEINKYVIEPRAESKAIPVKMSFKKLLASLSEDKEKTKPRIGVRHTTKGDRTSPTPAARRHFRERETRHFIAGSLGDFAKVFATYKVEAERARTSKFGIEESGQSGHRRGNKAITFALTGDNLVFRTQTLNDQDPPRRTKRIAALVPTDDVQARYKIPTIITREYILQWQRGIEELIKKEHVIQHAIKRDYWKETRGDPTISADKYIYVPNRIRNVEDVGEVNMIRDSLNRMYRQSIGSTNARDIVVTDDGVSTSGLLMSLLRYYLASSGIIEHKQKAVKKKIKGAPGYERVWEPVKTLRYGITTHEYKKGNPFYDLLKEPRYRLAIEGRRGDLSYINPLGDAKLLTSIATGKPENQRRRYQTLIDALKSPALNETKLVSGSEITYAIRPRGPIIEGEEVKPRILNSTFTIQNVTVPEEQRRKGEEIDPKEVLVLDRVLLVNSIIFSYCIPISNLPAIVDAVDSLQQNMLGEYMEFAPDGDAAKLANWHRAHLEDRKKYIADVKNLPEGEQPSLPPIPEYQEQYQSRVFTPAKLAIDARYYVINPKSEKAHQNRELNDLYYQRTSPGPRREYTEVGSAASGEGTPEQQAVGEAVRRSLHQTPTADIEDQPPSRETTEEEQMEFFT